MPQHQSAKKRVRQNEKRRQHNQAQRSKMRTMVRKVLEEDDKEKAEEYLKDAISVLDRYSQKGLLHPNNAARKKSKLTRHVNNL
ncbi:MAG: 30S ribosomal protein S20 [Balneolaceae bacterium]|nr:30S ribosomal protein S20 [Balneolaceae bacterium]